ncbi:MAG: hypothetical protein VX610_05200 [SAR324 cluster bacterium]|nr:hypothetical protein [SAR324 cluster bacterium]
MQFGMETMTQSLKQAVTVQQGMWASAFGLYEQSLALREQGGQQWKSQWQQWQQQATEQTQQQQERVRKSTEDLAEALWSGLGTQAVEARELLEQQWEQAQTQMASLQEQAVAQVSEQVERSFQYERQALDTARTQVDGQLSRLQAGLQPTPQAEPQSAAPQTNEVAPEPKASPRQASGRAGLQNRKPKNTTK